MGHAYAIAAFGRPGARELQPPGGLLQVCICPGRSRATVGASVGCIAIEFGPSWRAPIDCGWKRHAIAIVVAVRLNPTALPAAEELFIASLTKVARSF